MPLLNQFATLLLESSYADAEEGQAANTAAGVVSVINEIQVK
ncbi:hypothetical protein [Lamprocystis purpurea]|jgi:hypothetical protein|nr:hypothetical protein [Lamprocystis purpurea]